MHGLIHEGGGGRGWGKGVETEDKNLISVSFKVEILFNK
jgi:hypothetical protein